jgi:hypothetical protein
MKHLKNISENILQEYRYFFKLNDYVLIKDILTEECINLFMNNITFNEETLKDKPQFGRKHNNNFGKLDIILEFQKETLEFYRKIIGDEYFTTFAFAMEYIKDAEVYPHLDLICNEVSSTICYHDTGSYPLYICKDYMENNYNHRYSIGSSSIISEDKKIKLDIRCGDIGIFNGRNHLHWREKLNEDIVHRGILSHYSYTKPGTEEYKIKTSLKVPFENSVQSKIYHH